MQVATYVILWTCCFIYVFTGFYQLYRDKKRWRKFADELSKDLHEAVRKQITEILDRDLKK